MRSSAWTTWETKRYNNGSIQMINNWPLTLNTETGVKPCAKSKAAFEKGQFYIFQRAQPRNTTPLPSHPTPIHDQRRHLWIIICLQSGKEKWIQYSEETGNNVITFSHFLVFNWIFMETNEMFKQNYSRDRFSIKFE